MPGIALGTGETAVLTTVSLLTEGLGSREGSGK